MKEQIAASLLEIGAVTLKPNDPFTWSSGMLSPIYCDNRLTLSYPEIRSGIAKGLARLIQSSYPDATLIAGTATAGIAHAALVSDILGLPMCYVRGSAKGHGKGNMIEGLAGEGDRAVVIEDLISTGGSSIHTVQALRAAGADVLGVAAIFTYEFDQADQNFSKERISYRTLTDYSTLIQIAEREKRIEKDDINKLKLWRKEPSSLSWREEFSR
ncbi:orotate phosphoribosyltransferase [Bacillus sp. FJAT-42376]|uniref:orotate phosphoribosyltransferase n=1 Tax=Bacillus sp. FJAT-42376 TaxID=2014076 RepID=UPI000F5058AD|nr:orotate phosphoribosyltransferase [Bacillus sp. FJAT-42376]AZB42868.1 orotate phosphoribosyltransferase [Bacillus sp. FJAT-42376]